MISKKSYGRPMLGKSTKMEGRQKAIDNGPIAMNQNGGSMLTSIQRAALHGGSGRQQRWPMRISLQRVALHALLTSCGGGVIDWRSKMGAMFDNDD